MTTQQAKDWLQRGWNINKEIDALEKSKRAAYDLCTSSTVQYSAEPGGGSKLSYDGKMARYAGLCDLVNKRVDELTAIKCEILSVIMRVEDSTLRILLMHRYVNFQKWEQIAVEMNYSFAHVTKTLHVQSLHEIANMLNNAI